MADKIQQRRDTAARWAQYNPILLEGEVGYITDNPNQYKIGDGVHAWNELPLRGYSGTVTQIIGNDENAVLSQNAVTKLTGLNKFLAFSESKYYNKGQLTNYEGLVYKFTEIHVPGPWLGTDVVKSSLKEVFDNDIFNIFGNLFEDSRCIKLNGNRESTVTGLAATNYLPITGTEDIVVICGWQNVSSNITPMAFYDKNFNFLGCYNKEGENSQLVYVTKASEIPEGAKYVRCTANTINSSAYQAGMPKVWGVDFLSLIQFVNDAKDELTENIIDFGRGDSFSQIPNVVKGALYNVDKGAVNSKWVKNNNWDAVLIKIFDGTTSLQIQGISGTDNLLIWFSNYEIKHSNYISSTTSLSPTVPEGAVCAVLDVKKANVPEDGYKNLRVIQQGAGASRISLENLKHNVIGNFFTIKSNAVLEAGTVTPTIDGIDSTDFLPVTGLSEIVVEGGWRNADSLITPIAYYDENKNFISSYSGEKNSDNVYRIPVDEIPSGTKFIRCCAATNINSNPIILGVDIASVCLNSASRKDFFNEAVKNGSFSGNAYIDYNHLANIDSGGIYTGYVLSTTFDAAWIFIYPGATEMLIEGGKGTLVAWFNDIYPSEQTFLSQNAIISGKSAIPSGAVMGIVDLKKSDNLDGYSKLIITQGNYGAFRKEDIDDLLDSLGLIDYTDGDSLVGVQEEGYQRNNGTVLISSDYVHTNYDVNEYKKYHLKVTKFSQSSPIEVVQCFNSSGSVIGSLIPMDSPGFAVDEVISLPKGTVKIAVNWRSNYTPAPSLYEAISNYRNAGEEIDELEHTVNNQEQVLRKVVSQQVSSISDTKGYFINYDGTPKENSSFHYVRFDIDATKKYKVSSGVGGSTALYFVHYYNSDNVHLGIEYPVSTQSGGSFKLVEQPLNIPDNTGYILVNANNSNSPSLIEWEYGEYYDLSNVDNESHLMKVHVYGIETNLGNDLFYIRTPYNKHKTKDIIIVYYTNLNGLISPSRAYIGSSDLTDEQLMSSDYLVTSHSDSTAPLFNSSIYWHLFAQHGYVIPRISNTSGMTSSDVGAVWKDQLERQYTIGDVTDSIISLLPVITRGGEEGEDTRGWKTPNDAAITNLTWVSGGVVRDSFAVSNLSSTQLRPIMKSYNRTFVCDGKQIDSNGDYYCDEFKVSESQIGYDPAYITIWFPEPVLEGVPEMARFTWSYNFKGAQCCVNTTIDIRRKVECQSYGATQQQMFFDKGDYKAMFMIPKAAASDGVELDKPFNSPSSNSKSYYFLRNSTYLKDQDKPIDRLIGFLKNETDGTFLIGMAAGLSLVSGDTVTEKRNQNIAVATDTGNHHQRLGSFSPSNTNKFYIAAVNTAPFSDDGYNFPNTYFKEINYYVSYFDPSDNFGQVYWYKDGNSYVIYAHCQDVRDRIALELPEFMEGLSVEIVEKTDNAELLSGTIQNGNLFVSFKTNDSNYIVLKTK